VKTGKKVCHGGVKNKNKQKDVKRERYVSNSKLKDKKRESLDKIVPI
jgi:hypothetical protein